MNQVDLDTLAAIDTAVWKHYKRYGYKVTQHEAIRAIREGREEFLFRSGRGWSKLERDFRRAARSLSYDMVQMINNDKQDDPIRTIYTFYFMMDDVVCEAEETIKVQFAYYMQEGAMLILEMIDAWKGDNIRK